MLIKLWERSFPVVDPAAVEEDSNISAFKLTPSFVHLSSSPALPLPLFLHVSLWLSEIVKKKKSSHFVPVGIHLRDMPH